MALVADISGVWSSGGTFGDDLISHKSRKDEDVYLEDRGHTGEPG